MLGDVHLWIVTSVAKSPSNVKFYLLLKYGQYLSKPKYAIWKSKDSKHRAVVGILSVPFSLSHGR